MTLSQQTAAPIGHTTDRIVTLTPSKAQIYAGCPYRFAHEQKQVDSGSRSLLVGRWIHDIVHDYNLARMDGRDPSAEDLIAQKPIPVPSDGTPIDADWLTTTAADTLDGYRMFLETQGFAVILDAERYVRTPPRPVLGVSDCRVVFAGRFDVAAMRDDRSIACVDVKTGSVASCPTLAASPSSLIYHLLSAYYYGVDDIDIVQVNPLTAQVSSIRLTAEQIADGKVLCRRMVESIKDQTFEPVPSDYCAYCDIVSRCPAHTLRRDGWDTVF